MFSSTDFLIHAHDVSDVFRHYVHHQVLYMSGGPLGACPTCGSDRTAAPFSGSGSENGCILGSHPLSLNDPSRLLSLVSGSQLTRGSGWFGECVLVNINPSANHPKSTHPLPSISSALTLSYQLL